MLKKTGYNPANVKFVLVSADCGSNIVVKPHNKSVAHDLFLRGGGGTLLEALESLRVPKRPVKKPLRIPLDEITKISGVGTVVCGRIESGQLSLQAGPKQLHLFPDNLLLNVPSMMTKSTELKDASAGDDIGLKLAMYVKGYRMKMKGKVLSEPGTDQCRPA